MPTNKGGRPPKYKTKEEIKILIDAYFEKCQGEYLYDEDGQPLRTNSGNPIYKVCPKPPTVTGLALALGFNSRQALLNYQGKQEFNDTVTRAKSYIEEYAEQRLYDRDGVQGAKFNLINNFKGWSDRPKDERDQEVIARLDDILEGIDSAAKC